MFSIREFLEREAALLGQKDESLLPLLAAWAGLGSQITPEARRIATIQLAGSLAHWLCQC
jgi:hypothetical protein